MTQAWTAVVIPHTNKRLPWHSFNDKDYEFVSSYRRKFTLPATMKRSHVFVDFAGVMTASTVYINGHRLGEYKGGYTPFSFELTDYIQWDKENVLAVAVDSTERADIPPFGGQIDYLTFGGIYRDVSLRLVPATYLGQHLCSAERRSYRRMPQSTCSARSRRRSAPLYRSPSKLRFAMASRLSRAARRPFHRLTLRTILPSTARSPSAASAISSCGT